MATKTFDELKQLAIQIRDEKTNKQNTANRVGTAMLEGINKLEQDYYDKTAADEEFKKRDDKLIELANNVGLYNVDKHVPLGGGFYTSAAARAAVPSDVRKVGLIITYKTDATTSVTEQFIGSDVSGWTTDANWKNVGSEGGNKILEWKTDAATTRKKVPAKERKAGMQISYKPTDSDWVNEQYVGTSFTDTEWVKDSNWEKIPKQKQLTELGIEEIQYYQKDTPSESKIGDIFARTSDNRWFIYKSNGWDQYIPIGKIYYFYEKLYKRKNDDSLEQIICLNDLETVNKNISNNQSDIQELKNYNGYKGLDIFTLKETGKWINGATGQTSNLVNYEYSELDVTSVDYIFGKLSGYAGIGYRFLDKNDKILSYGLNNDAQPNVETIQYKFISIPSGAVKFQISYKTALKSDFKFILWGNNILKNILQLEETTTDLKNNTDVLSDILLYSADVSSLEMIDQGWIDAMNGEEKSGYGDSVLYRFPITKEYDKLIFKGVGVARVGWNIVDLSNKPILWGYTDDSQPYPSNGEVKEHIINIPENGEKLNVTVAKKYKELTQIIALKKQTNSSAENSEIIPQKFGKSMLGNVDVQPFPFTGYMHIIEYGQSLSIGTGSYQVITDTENENCKTLGNDIRNYDSSVLGNLKAISTGNEGSLAEDTGLSLSFILRNLFDRFVPNNTKFLTTSCGVGGYTVEMLSKNCTNGGDGKTISETDNIYNKRFIKAIDNAKIAVAETNIVCPFIFYMQGETNALTKAGNNMGIQPKTEASWTKELYKKRLLQLKNDMQADIMQKYGQSLKPMFFVYQTATGWQNKFTEDIPMAQLELSLENDDIILLPPHYHTPLASTDNVHLNANGYRWCGEQYAKAIFETMIKGYRYKPFMPMNYELSEKELRIDFYVPVPPITIDKTLVEEKQNYGFAFKIGGTYSEDLQNYSGGRSISPYKIEISGNSIIFKFTEQINNSVFEVAYASPATEVQGNIRDSDEWVSMYDYKDENELQSNAQASNKDKYVSLYGKKYPIYNWLISFYKVFVE